MLVSLGLAGLVAVAVFITTASVVILQRHETVEAKRELEDYKLSVDGRVADAKREGIEAGKIAGNAMVRASDLEKEAAVIQSTAATANERAAQIEEAAAWRILDTNTKMKAAIMLAKGIGGAVQMSWPANDPEAIFLVAQIDGVFRDANDRAAQLVWTITRQPRVFANGVLFNVRVVGSDAALVGYIRSAFSNAGIEFVTDEVPNVINDSPGVFISGGEQPAAMIFVGSKRPPNWDGFWKGR